MNEMRDYIWQRQYAIRPDETYDEGLQRVADHVAQGDEADYDRWLKLMRDNKFLPGGRILAGAGSAHGNLMNCYVTDGGNYAPGTTEAVMETATRLALITKVGGGNGVYLGHIAPRQDTDAYRGAVFYHLGIDHPDRDALFREDLAGRLTATATRPEDFLKSEGFSVLRVGDSIEDIWQAAAMMVECLLSTEDDVIVDLSRLRPEGTAVQGSGGTSSGPVSFALEVFQNFAKWAMLGGAEFAGPVATLRYIYAPTLRVIRQGGTRRGAGMATLPATHEDILDFISAKDLDREEAEGPIDTFNISVLADRRFMVAARDHPSSDAGIRLRLLADQAWRTGEPGLLFSDTINYHNPLAKVDGPIVSTNPCGEIGLYPGEPCDLGAMNLAEYVDDEGNFQYQELQRDVRAAVRFLDAVLDVEVSPLKANDEAMRDKRRLGLGIMGLADALLKMKIMYGSVDAQKTAETIARVMTEAAIDESGQMAHETGDAPAWGRVFGHPDQPPYRSRRNIALMTVAPTGTTSMLAGVSSGIEPIFSDTIHRRVGDEVKVIKHPDANGPWFVTAHDVAVSDQVRMQAAVQRGFDYNVAMYRTFAGNSISKTINLPAGVSKDVVLDAYQLAWNEGCKGITVYRDGSRANQVLSTEAEETEPEPAPKRFLRDEPPPLQTPPNAPQVSPEVYTGFKRLYDNWVARQLEEAEPTLQCVECGRLTDSSEFDDDTLTCDSCLSRILGSAELRLKYGIDYAEPVQRPVIVDGVTHKFEVGDRKVYVTINRNDNNELVECFINVGRPTDQEKVAADIIGRLVSLSLKFGAPVQAIVNHLSGHSDGTGAFAREQGYFGTIWEAVAKALEAEAHVRAEVLPQVSLCPECGAPLIHEEGCAKCYQCGYSACK